MSTCSTHYDTECMVRTAGDYWVVCKRSDSRELYVIICDRNANLTHINGKTLSSTACTCIEDNPPPPPPPIC